jgi:hypothetical protein
MRGLLIILFLVLIEQVIFGQLQSEKLEKIFMSNSISQLEKEFKELEKDKSSTIGNVWVEDIFKGEILNEITYHKISLNLVIPVKVGNRDWWGQKEHFIEFVSKDDTIFYRRIKDKDEKFVKCYFNENQLSGFISNYEKLYRTKINSNYDNLIFYEKGYYGVACGLAGYPPEKCEEMMALVTKKDSEELLNWIKSLSPLSQAYGILGMYILERKGFILKGTHKLLIEIVTNKSISISTCEGCFLGMRVPLKSVLTKDNLEEAYQYLKETLDNKN